MNNKSNREFLRHVISTVFYRADKAIDGADENFGEFSTPDNSKTPNEILAHCADLYEWALSNALGDNEWKPVSSKTWAKNSIRFYESLIAFDDFLASDKPFETEPERLFQGPIADSLTHIGQLMLLRRVAGIPVKGENFLKADIKIGVKDQHTC